jgi:hypothetical protein
LSPRASPGAGRDPKTTWDNGPFLPEEAKNLSLWREERIANLEGRRRRRRRRRKRSFIIGGIDNLGSLKKNGVT